MTARKDNPDKRGRKSTYKPDVHDKLVYELAKSGLGVGLCAKKMGICHFTIHHWRSKYPSFSEAYESGKKAADEVVVKSLFERAIGCSHPDVHVSAYMGDVQITPLERFYPPDVAAAKFWLTNRQPKAWKERIEQTGTNTVTVEAGDSIKELVSRIRQAKPVVAIEATPALEESRERTG